jgi:fused signal recognition particle receptor
LADLRHKTEQGVRKSRKTWFGRIADIFRRDAFSDEVWDELEELLISADVGIETAATLLNRVKQRVKAERLSETSQIRDALKREMIDLLSVSPPEPFVAATTRGEQSAIPNSDRSGPGTSHSPAQHLETLRCAQGDNSSTRHSDSLVSCHPECRCNQDEGSPRVILVVGVNGSGKTTSIAKLAYSLTSQGKRIILAAADTFRAAAIDQLKHWGEKAGAEVISHKPGGDPGAVAYDAVQAGYNRQADAVIIDTAGRLHTRFNLMEELKKVRRVVAKHDASAPHQVLLVMDATTGQNGLAQAKHFTEAVGVTGIILAKLDGTARGGVVFAVCNELGIPIAYIGTGEGITDFAPFDAEVFVNAIFS